MNKALSRKISYITFLGNIIIFLEHANLNLLSSTSYLHTAISLIDKIAVYAMLWFFFITAYLYYLNYNKLDDFKYKLKKRIYTLLIPYFIWNTIGMLLHYISGDYNNMNFFEIFRNSYIFYNGYGCANGPLWYIARLFTYFAISPLLYMIFEKKSSFKFIIIEALLIIINIIFKFNNYSFFYFLPFFICGCYISLHNQDLLTDNKNSKQKTIIILIILTLFSYVSKISNNIAINYLHNVFSMCLIIILVRNIHFNNKPSYWIMNSGMFIYCSHDIIFRTIRYFLFKLPISFNEIVQILYILVSGTSIVCIYWVLYLYFPKTLNLLCGGRNQRKL